MEWVPAAMVFLTAVGYLTWRHGWRYAVTVALFLLGTALGFTLIKRWLGEPGALGFSLLALALAGVTIWRRSRKPGSPD